MRLLAPQGRRSLRNSQGLYLQPFFEGFPLQLEAVLWRSCFSSLVLSQVQQVFTTQEPSRLALHLDRGSQAHWGQLSNTVQVSLER